MVRHTIIVHNRNARRTHRTQAAIDAQQGLQLYTMEQLAARLAGGFLQPIDDDALNVALAAALVTPLGDLDAIKELPGFRRAAAAPLAQAWRAGVEGDIVSPRVAIAEGARFCGSVAMPRTSVPPRQAQQPYNAVVWAAMTARRRRPATSPRVPRPLAGSYLWPGRDRRRTKERCPAPAASPACGREDHRHKARLTDGEVGWYCRLEVGS